MDPADTRRAARTIAELLDLIAAGTLEASPTERAYLAGVAQGVGAAEPTLPSTR